MKIDNFIHLIKGISTILILPISACIVFIYMLIDIGRNPYEDYSADWCKREAELRKVKEVPDES